jgi:hypothetical protein
MGKQMETRTLLAALDLPTLQGIKRTMAKRIADFPESCLVRDYQDQLDAVEEELAIRAHGKDREFATCVGRALGILVCIASLFAMAPARADLRDIEGNVAQYLEANPSIADQMPAEKEPAAFEFATTGARNVQLGITALILVDMAQTLTIARSQDCLEEGNPLAAAFIGKYPQPARVVAVNALAIVGHWALGSYLDRKARVSDRWAIAQRVYQALTIGGHGAAVANNVSKGIRPFSSYSCGSAS